MLDLSLLSRIANLLTFAEMPVNVSLVFLVLWKDYVLSLYIPPGLFAREYSNLVLNLDKPRTNRTTWRNPTTGKRTMLEVHSLVLEGKNEGNPSSLQKRSEKETGHIRKGSVVWVARCCTHIPCSWVAFTFFPPSSSDSDAFLNPRWHWPSSEIWQMLKG